jgi:hypothetical protein
VIVPEVFIVRLVDMQVPESPDQTPVPVRNIVLLPAIAPVPVQAKPPWTEISLVAIVRVAPVATERFPLIVVACDNVKVEVAVQLMFGQIFTASVKVQVPAILSVDPARVIVPAI